MYIDAHTFPSNGHNHIFYYIKLNLMSQSVNCIVVFPNACTIMKWWWNPITSLNIVVVALMPQVLNLQRNHHHHPRTTTKFNFKFACAEKYQHFIFIEAPRRKMSFNGNT